MNRIIISAIQCFTDISSTKPNLDNMLHHSNYKNSNDYDVDVINSLVKANQYILQNFQHSDIYLLKHLNFILALDSSTRGQFSLQQMHMNHVNIRLPRPSETEAHVIIWSGVKSSNLSGLIVMMLNLWRAQLFYDANKRTAYFFTNYYLIHKFNKILILTPKKLGRWYELLKIYFEIGKCTQLVNKIVQECIYSVAN